MKISILSPALFLAALLSHVAQARLSGETTQVVEQQETLPDDNDDKEEEELPHRRHLKFFGANPTTGAPVYPCHPLFGCDTAQADEFCRTKNYHVSTTFRVNKEGTGFEYINCHYLRRYNFPMLNGQYYLAYGGQPAADAFCYANGHSRPSRQFAKGQVPGPTRYITGGMGPYGDGFAYIDCIYGD